MQNIKEIAYWLIMIFSRCAAKGIIIKIRHEMTMRFIDNADAVLTGIYVLLMISFYSNLLFVSHLVPRMNYGDIGITMKLLEYA